MRSRSRTSTCGADFMMSLTRMMAVAPLALKLGVKACGGGAAGGGGGEAACCGGLGFVGGCVAAAAAEVAGLAAAGALTVPGGSVVCLATDPGTLASNFPWMPRS